MVIGSPLELGEIRDPQHSSLVLLQKDHLLLGALQRLPLLHPPLCSVRSRRCQSSSGRVSSRCSSSVLGSSAGAFSSMGTSTLSHTSASGSFRVRQ
jgi:hypothetical protein